MKELLIDDRKVCRLYDCRTSAAPDLLHMDSSDVNIAIRIWSKPYSIDKVKTIHGKEFSLINLPFYLIGNLRSVLDAVAEE